MSQIPGVQMIQNLPGGRLGVMDATRMGWRLLVSDFWPIWLIGLVAYAIQAGAGAIGAVPYIGACFSIAMAIFLQPPLQAGVFYAIRRKIDGAPAQVGDVFEGFRQRYWPSVVTSLPGIVVGIVGGVLIVGIVFAVVFGGFGVSGGKMGDEAVAVAIAVGVAAALPVILAIIVVSLLFIFGLLAVWDHPGSGWDAGWAAVKDSVRVVKANLWSVIGLSLLFGLIGLGAFLGGAIACCVGVFFTIPALVVWYTATLIYLYRAWTGQPLVQPMAPAPQVPYGQPPYGQSALPPAAPPPGF